MPKRTDIQKVLIIGAGPIVIGQACEFDYSGTQACKALREEGYKVVLVNSNPATIMTDPEFADATYIEPVTPEAVEKIIEKEKPDALLPTLGGQTGLNTAMALWRSGVLQKHGVEMIGAKAEAIEKGEDRLKFKQAMQKIGLDCPVSGVAHTLDECWEVARQIGAFPLIIRPAYTLGGTGGGIAYNREEFDAMAQKGLEASPVSEILIEESLIGWKEFETEVMRDKNDNCVIVCSIENLDPMGVHTGDFITVAPVQTLTDKEWQNMRDASFACIREIGVETGGSNIQFAVNPANGRMTIIEMNPRVSRSSALASKATGFPIAKFAAKLAVGYTLDEIKNDITKETPASFEPSIDYVVTKIPRFAFEKFPQADPTLTTQMKSVGEVMAIGRTFKESLQKALRGLEIGVCGLYGGRWGGAREIRPRDEIERKLITPCAERIFYIRHAFRAGFTAGEIHRLSKIDPWFLQQIKEIIEMEDELVNAGQSQRNLLNRWNHMNLTKRLCIPPGSKVRLADWDADDTGGLKKEKAHELLERNVTRMGQLEYRLYAEGRQSLLIVLQGMDAAGKDGTIRNVMTGLNPQSCRVTAFKVPSAEERARDFLWRIHKAVPAHGEIGIFNRSHYEDVLVVRVHDLVPKEVWSARYEQINHFEKFLTMNGTKVLKFFLHISKDEQRRRLLERVNDPTKNWKITLADVAERRYWGDYQHAYEDALARCSTKTAPWFIIPANKKWFRNIAVSQIIVEALEEMDPRLPKPPPDLAQIVIK